MGSIASSMANLIVACSQFIKHRLIGLVHMFPIGTRHARKMRKNTNPGSDQLRGPPNIVMNTEAGYDMSLADVAAAEVAWGKWYKRFQAFMDDVDLLILPGNAYPPYRLDDGAPKEINGAPLENYMDASLIRSALTLTGNPVIAVPCGLDETGTPFGFQIAGKRHGEKELLSAALALETLFKQDPELARPVPDLEKLK